MARIAQFRSIGGLLAVALVAHLWMLPSFTDLPGAEMAAVGAAATADTPVAADCPSAMGACATTVAETKPLVVAAALSTLAVVLLVPRRRASSTERRRRHGPEPSLTPVTERVLLLE